MLTPIALNEGQGKIKQDCFIVTNSHHSPSVQPILVSS